MKLLTKTTVYYLLFSILVFITGGFVFYRIIKTIVYSKVNESLHTEKRIIEEQILHSDNIPDFTLYFGHQIEVILYNTPNTKWNIKSEMITDTMMYDSAGTHLIPYRHLLVNNNTKDNRSYRISIFRSTMDYEKVVGEIFFALLLMFLSLLLVLVSVNYWVSKKIWVPFYNTIRKINLYDVRESQPLTLSSANVKEFRQLNDVLSQMAKRIRNDFLNLKEFTENMSHETQNPIAIIISKLELLIQNENLGKEQMQLIQPVYEAASKLSRLNHSISLISKIDNYQFVQTENIDLSLIIEKYLQNLHELIVYKNLEIRSDFKDYKYAAMNPDLADILISNLLSNAIRHNINRGKIFIVLVDNNLIIKNTGNDPACDPGTFFERFRKAKHSDSLGLGLSIVKKIADLYNFKISYEYKDEYHVLSLLY